MNDANTRQLLVYLAAAHMAAGAGAHEEIGRAHV